MFRGINSINLDAKGRMAIPSRYRGTIDDHCQGITKSGSFVLLVACMFVVNGKKVAETAWYWDETPY